MTSTQTPENNLPLLKTDTAGRVFTPTARRKQLLDEFEHSGLSAAKFAALVGVKYSTFAAWRLRLGQSPAETPEAKAPEASPKSVRWLEAVLDQAQTQGGSMASALRLQLPGGAGLEISQASQIPLAAALLAALAQPAQPC
jgi:hypothetical protein